MCFVVEVENVVGVEYYKIELFFLSDFVSWKSVGKIGMYLVARNELFGLLKKSQTISAVFTLFH